MYSSDGDLRDQTCYVGNIRRSREDPRHQRRKLFSSPGYGELVKRLEEECCEAHGPDGPATVVLKAEVKTSYYNGK
jgi:hypothetical protein